MYPKTTRLSALVILLFVAFSGRETCAEQAKLATIPPDATAAEQLASLQNSEGFQQLITAIVRDNIPHEFEEEDGWGETKEVWDGLKIWMDGLQIKTKRRKKKAKHGSWKRYRVRLVDPEQNFQIRIANISCLPQGRTQFDLQVDTKLDAFARLAQWERGIQLIALSANATAHVRFRATCSLGATLDPSTFPPDLVLDPVVHSAELELVKFRLIRVSQIGGSIAYELGKALREILEDQVSKQRRKLPEKINRQIDKNRDDLRFSIRDVVDSKWGGLATTYLDVDQDSESNGSAGETDLIPLPATPGERVP